jgi:probable HAF family extracellular repeat protein
VKGSNLKYTLLISTPAVGLLALLAMPVQMFAQEHKSERVRYAITDLGIVGNPPAQPYVISNNGLVGGAAANDGRIQAALWYRGLKLDIGKPGLKGANSATFGVNEWGQAVGEAETLDPNGEDFCGFNAYGFPSNAACLPFLWQDGVMTRLPTLGGANGVANMINNRGEAVGYAEKDRRDGGCPVDQFEPVIWKDGKIKQLHTFPGDPNGVAAWINDKGQVVGASGTCAPFNPNSGLYLLEAHALLWQGDTVTDLGNLGGTGAGAGNHACAINNHGQVVGHSDLPFNATFHGFLWTRESGMQDLGALTGDFASVALGINDRGEAVGASIGDSGPRAFLWENGEMIDLNTLIPASTGLTLLVAQSINADGQIVGFGVTNTGEIHGFLASRRERNHSARK